MKYQFKSVQLIATIAAAVTFVPSIASANELDLVDNSIEKSTITACSKCKIKGKSKRASNLRDRELTALIAPADLSAPPAAKHS
jgi:hypothetical protein